MSRHQINPVMLSARGGRGARQCFRVTPAFCGGSRGSPDLLLCAAFHPTPSPKNLVPDISGTLRAKTNNLTALCQSCETTLFIVSNK